MAKEGTLIPADLYVQPPKNLRLKQKSDFSLFVRQFPPEYFIQADVIHISRYLRTEKTLMSVEEEIAALGSFVTENDLGTESIHPLVRVHDIYLNQLIKIGMLIQVTPPQRPMGVGGGGMKDITPQKKTVRMLFKYTNGDDEGVADSKEVIDVSA